MSERALSCVYGSSCAAVSAYNEKTGELFVAVNRIIKKMKIRSGSATILKFEAERRLKSISMDEDFLVALDIDGRIYLYNLLYNVEVGRMSVKGCLSACVKDRKIYLDYMGYLQVWIVEDNGFFSFKKEKHITGHQDSIVLMNKEKEEIITGSRDGSLREYRIKEGSSVGLMRNKAHPVAAHKVGKEAYAVWASGEITKLAEMEGEWTQVQRKFTMHNLLHADISSFGDMAVLIDTSHNVYLYSTMSEGKEPIQKIFVSDGIVHARFIEEDEWIVLSGNGSVIWEWKTNTLLFNEQDSIGQRVAVDIGSTIISGTEKGDLFIWDKGSATCTKKLAVHTSSISCIIPVERGFISIGSNGECKVHKAGGTVVKQISSEMTVLHGDADEDLLVLAGPGKMKIFDIKRSRVMEEHEIDMPLSVKIIGSSILVATMQGLTTYFSGSVSGIDGPEQFVFASISETKTGLMVSCLGESGLMYTYNGNMEALVEYRVLPAYCNGMDRHTPLGMVHTESGEVVVTYKLARPDKVAGTRESLFAAMFYGTQEIEKWKVSENALKSTGYLFLHLSVQGTSIGICTETGVFVFSDKYSGVNPMGAWQKESPEEIKQKIMEGDALRGVIGATRLQSSSLMKLSLITGDPALLAKYLPIDLSLQTISVVVSVLSDGLVERSLIFIKELLKRYPASSVLRHQLSLALSSVLTMTHETTGCADALVAFPHFTSKENKTEEEPQEQYRVLDNK